MSVTFDVNMNVRELYKFSMNNTYRKLMGILWIIFSIAVAVVTVFTWGDVDISRSVLLIFMASLYTVVNPALIWFRVRRQFKNNESLRNTLTYVIDEKGISVSQGELTETAGWEEVWKSVRYGSQIVIYITTVRAFVFPVECIGDGYGDLVEILKKGLADRNHVRR